VGLANTAIGIASIVAPLLGAWLATRSYGWLFGVSTAVNVAALVALHWWVREPRFAETLQLSQLEDIP
jgi:MFS family permease